MSFLQTRPKVLAALLFCLVAVPLGLVAMASSSVWPTIRPTIQQDTALEERISQIMAPMTVEQKAGQLVMAEIGSISPEDVKKFGIGGLLNGGGSWPTKKPAGDLGSWLALADLFHDASIQSETGIPIIWGTDAVHGHNNVSGATIFPHNIGLGAANNPDLMRDIGTATAREVSVTGIGWVFAPTLAVVDDRRWGRTYEGLGEDPKQVGVLARELIIGLQGHPALDNFLSDEKVIATAKHFIADGGATYGTGRNGYIDQGDYKGTEEVLRERHGRPYFDALGVGVQTVMASFSSWQGQKMHGHKYLLTDVLKDRLGFDGFVVGDWNGHEQIVGCGVISCDTAVNAGVDMIMVPVDWRLFLDSLIRQVKSGTITNARLDDAVRRILRVKLRSGVFDGKRPSERALAGRYDLIGHPSHRAVARRAVSESLVLLKNDNQALPVQNQRVFLTGKGLDNVRLQSGGWTIDWQGTGVRTEDYLGFTTIGDGLRKAIREAGGELLTSETGLKIGDKAIFVFGEAPYAEFEGDISDSDFKEFSKKDLKLMQDLQARGVHTVGVFLTGRPRGVDHIIAHLDAFVVAWLPGSEGAGVADVLVRSPNVEKALDFVGKLPFSWPQNGTLASIYETIPPRFELGYGLKYQD